MTANHFHLHFKPGFSGNAAAAGRFVEKRNLCFACIWLADGIKRWRTCVTALAHLGAASQVLDQIFYRRHSDLLLRLGQVPEEVEEDAALLQRPGRATRSSGGIQRHLHHPHTRPYTLFVGQRAPRQLLPGHNFRYFSFFFECSTSKQRKFTSRFYCR